MADFTQLNECVYTKMTFLWLPGGHDRVLVSMVAAPLGRVPPFQRPMCRTGPCSFCVKTSIIFRQKRVLRRHQRCKLFSKCTPPNIQPLVTHPTLLISVQIITFIKWDPSCTKALLLLSSAEAQMRLNLNEWVCTDMNVC